MKTIYKKTVQIVLVILIASVSMSLQAQNMSASYITISGVVKDKKSNKKLEYVTITVPGTNIGTITNTDGEFSIKVKSDFNAKALEISHIGYFNTKYPIKEEEHDVTIYLIPHVSQLKDVIVQAVDARNLVEQAIGKIGDNNSTKANMLTGFYRETVKKRRNYINISEAILEIYKTSYTDGISGDRVQVFKGRRLLSPKASDTLIVKLQGGPNLSAFLDVVKNPELILDVKTLSDYKFELEESAMLNERPHYVISFTPQVVYPYPLHYGRLYIDKQSLAFSRAEFNLSMDDRNKATQAILRKKPFNLRFKPEEVSFLVTYKLQDGKSYLNYVWSEVKFKCDWKRRLFSTGYTIVSEMVVTDRKDENVIKIPNKEAFKENYVLSDKVGNFYDPHFWEDYNIIEPTESLENAVNKLKKQYK
ncbi:carboxypeptidase-like regulatory domain-containing protein [Dysgonomonas sp. Marseille-P4677]|uniref:carboxypeptidase-like regulatory domain-containing protein n=1 Tax=Dysgonomonas sp. Marseille-P4677 TaxID=2364790 RepID=UPI001912147B|nr:carboxypeptidase-like regulatory domain-containing protein [Dysgonomonas sp. Marseille-P4677]MBK5720895.1 carboxypeptidase-like regulatory domain-containing protein [Dysgonomonas sp. Marseille-P4677]